MSTAVVEKPDFAVFYLGAPMPHWLWSEQVWPEPTPTTCRNGAVPLCVSHRRLEGYRTLRAARVHWFLDSGGFTELRDYGSWDRVPPHTYAAAVARYDQEIGNLGWAAPQDWMCEPVVIHGGRVGRQRFAGTGLSVRDHQHRTVENYLLLRELWPRYADSSCPFMPVLQGYQVEEYLACVQLYLNAGVDLFDPDVLDPGGLRSGVVGVGSVCRRQKTAKIETVFRELAATGLPLHGFGVKTQGLNRYARYLTSADSQAWCYAGQRTPADTCPAQQPRRRHKNEANCVRYALTWRNRVLAAVDHGTADRPEQLQLDAA